MPRNSANKTMLSLASGQTHRMRFSEENRRAIGMRATSINPSSNFVFKLQSAAAGRDETQTITLAGSGMANDTGTFTLTFPDFGLTTGAITFHTTAATLDGRVQTAVDAAFATLGYPANTVRVKVASASSSAASIVLIFSQFLIAQNNIKAGAGRVDLSATTMTITALTGSTSATTAETVKGYAEGEIPDSLYTDVSPDGASGATVTVTPYGEKMVAYGYDSDSTNLVGPFVNIVCTGGSGQLELDVGDAMIHDLKSTIPGLT